MFDQGLDNRQLKTFGASRHPASTMRIVLLSTCFVCSRSFTVFPTRTRVGWVELGQRGSVRQRASDKDEDPDLLEYFDPLLSPHAYPHGISPNEKPQEETPDKVKKERYDPLRLSERFGFENKLDDKPEQQESFDPTPSPHSYPNGAPSALVEDEMNEEEVDILDVFDPTLSPHMYPNGIPSAMSKRKKPRVGILLMDHGSRNQASNDRLHELAAKYQETVGQNVVVRAAHMEISSPSIPEGLEDLLGQNVDEIVCHPYFLSPYGRHVAEDIPRIVDEAIEALSIEIPIATTDPVGAHTDIMINAIQTVVQQTADVLEQKAAE